MKKSGVDKKEIVLTDEAAIIQGYDFRLQAITTLTKEFVNPVTGKKQAVGSPVFTVVNILFDRRFEFSFGLPNLTALFVSFSDKLWRESQEFLLGSNFKPEDNPYFIENIMHPNPEGFDQLFDFLEKRMGSIVFAYSALESFANENIPNNFIFERERKDKKGMERFDKDQIEKSISLDDKLSEILPKTLNIENPQGIHLWQRYMILKNLRDRVIHSKTKDRRSSGVGEKTIWVELINKSSPNFALEAFDIIKYYLSKTPLDKKPRWVKKFGKIMF